VNLFETNPKGLKKHFFNKPKYNIISNRVNINYLSDKNTQQIVKSNKILYSREHYRNGLK